MQLLRGEFAEMEFERKYSAAVPIGSLVEVLNPKKGAFLG